MMKLSAPEVSIELQPRRTVDDEDWVRVQVLVKANGFLGDFEAWLQVSNLRLFDRELEVMYSSVGTPSTAMLACAERGIQIELKMQRLGGILGTYAFESEPDATPTVLSGGFRIDQSYLPDLRRSVQALIASLVSPQS